MADWGSEGLQELGEPLSLSMSGLKRRQLKACFQMCVGLLPLWGLGKSAGLKKILFANLLIP